MCRLFVPLILFYSDDTWFVCRVCSFLFLCDQFVLYRFHRLCYSPIGICLFRSILTLPIQSLMFVRYYRQQLQRLGFKMTIAATVAASTGSTNGGSGSGTSSAAATAAAAARAKQNGSASGGDQSRVAKQTRTVQRERERAEREQLVLWRQPLQTLKFCGREVALLLNTYWQKWVWSYSNGGPMLRRTLFKRL